MSDPEEDEARIGGERRDRKFKKLFPGHLCVLWVDEDHIEFARVERAELGHREEHGSMAMYVDSGTFEG